MKLVGVYLFVLFFAALGATVWFAYDVLYCEAASPEMWIPVGIVIFIAVVLMCGGTVIGAFTHELGHTVFGALIGFRTVQFSVGKFVFTKHGIHYDLWNETAGYTSLFPKTEKNIRQRYAFVALGGIIFNLVYGAVFLTLYFVLPHHPALVFFELLAPMNLFTGLVQLVPMPQGRTDFSTFYSCLKNRPIAQVACNILQAQSILYGHSYRGIPRELLYDVPVIREDDPLFIILLTLRMQYCLVLGDVDGVKEAAARMDAIYFDENEFVDGDVAALLYYANKVFLGNEERAAYFKEKINNSGKSFYSCLMYAADGDEGAVEYAKKFIAKEPLYGSREADELMLKSIKTAQKNSAEAESDQKAE